MEETDPVLKAIKNYKNHPSILRIKSSLEYQKVFSFKYFMWSMSKGKVII